MRDARTTSGKQRSFTDRITNALIRERKMMARTLTERVRKVAIAPQVSPRISRSCLVFAVIAVRLLS
jgi:hypothetical protein